MARVWGEEFFTSHFSGAPVFFQPFTVNRKLSLEAIRTSVVFYNNPTLTSLELRIYSYKSGALRTLLHTSNVRTKAYCITEENGVRDIPFVFDPRPALMAENEYALVLWANGYTGDGDSHIAWQKDFPDPSNPTGLAAYEMNDIGISPFRFTMIGAKI